MAAGPDEQPELHFPRRHIRHSLVLSHHPSNRDRPGASSSPHRISRGIMTRLLAVCIAALAIFVSPAGAETFPNRVSGSMVPFTPGGSNDIVAREIANGLQARFNQTAVVENKPGGGGVIAYSYVAKAPADGYLMLITPASFTMGPHLSKNPLYNPVTEYAPIILVADVPFVMVVPPSLPVKTVKEFVALAKSTPEKLRFGSVGVGTPQHL